MVIQPIKHSLCALIMLFSAGTSFAEQSSVESELESLRQQVAGLRRALKDANDRHSADIKKLRKEVEPLKRENAAGSTAAPQSNTPAPAPAANEQPMLPANTAGTVLPGNFNLEYPGSGAAPGRSSIYQNSNPDISAIGDFISQVGQIPKGETPDSLTATNKSRAQLQEVEFGFSNPVDPYGRSDLILSVERQDDGSYDAHIEEGYFTYTHLPYDLQVRVGKFYSVFGRANLYHTHAMPWVDRPLPIRTLFGDEGLNDAGGEISWLVPNPWDAYIELTQDVQSNGNEAEFAGSGANGLMYVTHLKNYFDLTSDTSLEFGGSFATGTNGTGNGGSPKTNVEGLDLTYKWKPYQQGLYKSLTWMSEALFNQKDEASDGTVTSQGWYSSLEYQLTKRWFTFERYGYSEYPDSSSLHENAYSVGLTFHQSEFMFWRLQYEHTNGDNYAGDVDRDQLFLQADFLIGLHPAHKY
jgi:hypothetical protein